MKQNCKVNLSAYLYDEVLYQSYDKRELVQNKLGSGSVLIRHLLQYTHHTDYKMHI